MGAMESGGVMESQPWKGLETSSAPLSHFTDGQTGAPEVWESLTPSYPLVADPS